MISHEEYLEATRRGEEMRAKTPHAVSARYDRRIGRIVIRLSTGLDIAFSPKDAQGLETATWQQLQEIEIEGDGFGIHFPVLDADLYIPSLLEGFLGSKKWMAARLGECISEERFFGRQAQEICIGGLTRTVAPLAQNKTICTQPLETA
jgi:hypothetical protein